jgi:hypothetical protein
VVVRKVRSGGPALMPGSTAVSFRGSGGGRSPLGCCRAIWAHTYSQLSAHPAEQVYDGVLAAITDGQVQPNERLIQDELATRFGVSRQPVRLSWKRVGPPSPEPRVTSPILTQLTTIRTMITNSG